MAMPALEQRRWTAAEVQNLPEEDERPEVLTEQLTWRLDGHPEQFALDVPHYFARVHGERCRVAFQ